MEQGAFFPELAGPSLQRAAAFSEGCYSVSVGVLGC